jgi:hypothetical protein
MITIEPGEKVIRDSRLTIVRTIGTLWEKFIDAPGGLKDKIKAEMKRKNAAYAESDHVVAHLLPGGSKKIVDPVKLFELFGKKRITLGEFLACVSVKKQAVEQLLAPPEITAITVTAGVSSPSLMTEFKPGISTALEELDRDGAVVKLLLKDVGRLVQ